MTSEDNHNNSVELVGIYGGDIEHACSAWTSTSRDLDIKDKNGRTKRDRIPDLLKMLAKDGHHTPFEKSSLHFLCTTEIASHIHLLKHRIGTSINAESARYKELKDDKFYVPSDWNEAQTKDYIEFMELAYSKYHEALNNVMLDLVSKGVSKKEARKRAKESARFYLPYGNQLQCDIMFNFRSFAHFIRLRYSIHAQEEICNIAKDMLVLVKNTGKFDHTLKAFGFVDENDNIVEPFQ